MFSRFTRISIFIVIVLMIGPSACNPCGDVLTHFKVYAISAENYFFPLSTSRPMELATVGAEVEWSQYVLNVPFNVQFTASVRGTGTSLYATSCIEKGGNGADTGIKDLYVIVLNDYNENYHQNDTINSMVSVGADHNYLSTVEIFESENAPKLYAQQFVVDLLEAPSEDIANYQFKVVLNLLNGEIFTATSAPVTLRK
jgi:hypothetical protein